MKKYISICWSSCSSLPATPQVTEIPVILRRRQLQAPLFTPTACSTLIDRLPGEEPNTLYPYGNLNAAARSVLSALYDGRWRSRIWYEPIILERSQTLTMAMRSEPIYSCDGDQVVDSSGNLVTLATGKKIRPSSFRSDDCAIIYDGFKHLQMINLYHIYHAARAAGQTASRLLPMTRSTL